MDSSKRMKIEVDKIRWDASRYDAAFFHSSFRPLSRRPTSCVVAAIMTWFDLIYGMLHIVQPCSSEKGPTKFTLGIYKLSQYLNFMSTFCNTIPSSHLEISTQELTSSLHAFLSPHSSRQKRGINIRHARV